MENALAEGKSVLVAREPVFNPLVGFQPGSIFGGDYRPPLPYWLHRDTQSQLVLGSSSAKEGRGRLLTGDYSFFIIEPGYYVLVRYVDKTITLGCEVFYYENGGIRSAN